MSGVLIYLILFAIIFVRFMRQGKKGGSGRGSAGSRSGARGRAGTKGQAVNRSAAGEAAKWFFGPMASDGHRVPKDQDISCQRYGHRHEEFDTPRFIPHEDPEDGYIVLNGVKMKLSEADRYEDRI